MRLQIDTTAKIIKLEQSAKITEILSIIKKLLPNEWKDYSLETNTTIYGWYNPIYVPMTYTYPSFDDGWKITCTDQTEIYCIETQN